MADTDSVADVEAPAEDSQPTGTQMGDGLFDDIGNNPAVDMSPDDTLLSAPNDATRPSEEASQSAEDTFDLSSVDILRVDVATIPEVHRGVVLNAQTQMRNMQGMYTKQSDDLSKQMKALQDAQHVALTQQTVQNTLQGMQEQDEYANLTPQQQQALTTVDARIDAKIADLKAMTDRFNAMEQQLYTINTTQQTQQSNAMSQEINVARAKYGNDLDVYTQQIVALMNTANPQNGQRYTVTQAYELASGRASAISQQMAAANAGVRNGTKRQIAPTVNGTPPSSNSMDGPINNQELYVGLASLGFEE